MGSCAGSISALLLLSTTFRSLSAEVVVALCSPAANELKELSDTRKISSIENVAVSGCDAWLVACPSVVIVDDQARWVGECLMFFRMYLHDNNISGSANNPSKLQTQYLLATLRVNQHTLLS